jgi:Inverse autotransporter, beta-domain
MNISGAMRGVGRCAGIIVLAAAPAFAQSPAESARAVPKWGPFIDLDGKAGTQRNIGEGDLFVPLLQNGSSMLFTDLRGRFDDRGGHEGNFGLGVRHMLASGWNLGAYGYFDRRHSALGNGFDQATFGAEALSLDWDARANFYQPVGPRIANLGSTSSSTASLSGTSIEVTTTGAHSQEVAMQGFDGEIGWRVPVFAADDTTQLRVYAGGYDFHASGVRSIAGPRGRIDLTVHEVPHLWTGARLELETEVQHDAPRGTQAFALLSLRIPLQIFASAAPSSLTPMERRMEDPIVRDVDVVSETRTQATPTLVETANETANGSPITVLSSASTTGAALPGAVAAAGANSTVILSGSFSTTATTTLQSGQTVMGAGSLAVKTPSGRTATLTTTTATISGVVAGTAVAMANNSTLSGLTVDNTESGGAGAVGVQASGATGATIANSTISATTTGTNNALGVNIIGASTVTVTGNHISGTATSVGSNGNGFVLNSATAVATVTGNTFDASGGVADAVALNSGTINAGSTGNAIRTGNCSGGAVTGSIGFTDGSTCP